MSFIVRWRQEKEALLPRLYLKYLLFKTRQLYKYYYCFLSLRKIDLLVVWNGAYLEAASGVKAARDLGIKVIFMENGFFPRTLVMDEKGVNANNSLVGKTADFYRKIEPDPVKLAKLKETRLVPRALRKNFTGTEEVQLPPKYFFVPFQVHTDTQVLLNSPHIRNMYELVDTVYQALKKFNRNNHSDYWLVIKEHPSDYGRIDYTDLKKKYQGEKVVFVTTAPSSELIEQSQAVITINSTVGLEALLKEKPVITLGNAFYNVDGIVFSCRDLTRLDELMGKALTEPLDRELIDKFLYYLRYVYLVETDKNHPTRDNIIPILERLGWILAKNV
ncbi:MAG TPA: hypothetical protein GXX33_01110 [Firmicutes bacterium]|nr:hypothetical protein [Bacillota bacterium]